MTKVHVTASRSYDVIIGEDLLASVAEHIKPIAGKAVKVCIVSDDNVFPLYGKTVADSLTSAGFECVSFVFPHGENSKCLKTYGELLNFLCASRLTRSDLVIALGGGVVGDLTGFAAATYLRGVKFVQIPTTLLSMVDSSVGGKTAIDLDGGKNQAGCFYQPSLVICDIKTIDTLPDEQYRCGCAEVIKYGVLYSEDFFNDLDSVPAKQQLEHVITTCVQMKRDVVAKDEFDNGERAKLNLGHTAGHGIEAESGFSILHGNAVAAGMAIISNAAAKRGLCTYESARRISALIEKYELPVSTDYTAESLAEHALADKKMSGKSLSIIVPLRIGECKIEKIPSNEFIMWLQDGGVR